ncbi:Transcription factor atf1 [Choanephora cucurbitarum]|uniref:Transcription factor atf1 n=1 Tax=Choanephora cucurbitarum TaxID=101091 RepID=A0A1C7N5P1_9FUNG|nr:Transcription factor atf1 [Choanephora cucurbitarum]
MQQLNPSQAFNTIYDTSSYASPQQSHNVINGQYNYHHHRGSLPIIPTTSDSFMPSMEEEEEVDMTGAPYVRRHTESSIPSKQTHRKQKNSQSKKSMAMEGNEEERRKHFLERNRQAALKCRQRKKQWLADLQHRVEFLSTDNEQLQSQATMLREEVINLKTLLLAHRDCRVAQSNGTTMGMIQSISSNLTMPFHSTGVITPNTDMMMASEIVHSQPQ